MRALAQPPGLTLVQENTAFEPASDTAVSVVVPLKEWTTTVDPIFGDMRGKAWSTQIGQHFLLHSTDLFVTPYSDAEQIVSGALSFAIAMQF